MPYQSVDALRTAVEARLANAARDRGVRVDRLRRQAVFERMLVRLEVARPGTWVLKGGTALEVRWRERARATRDLDLAMRERPDDGDDLRDLLVTQLGEDPDGDGFRFQVGPPAPLAEDAAGRPAWRFTVRALLAGREFASVRLDVVARSEELFATERLPLPDTFAFAGFPRREVEAVAPAQHFAEKLHALTRRFPDRENTRIRDLVDLVLLIDRDLLDPAETVAVTERLFAARGTHRLPDDLPDPPASWGEVYATVAGDLAVETATVADAMARLRRFWSTARAAGSMEDAAGGAAGAAEAGTAATVSTLPDRGRMIGR